jgi:abortive infection bacteriophage resistance protein
MRFNKPAIALADQVRLMQQRGLVVADPTRAEHYLGNIGYYRLSAYSLPHELPTPAGQHRQHQFKPGTTFEQILSLYVFDRKLRLLVIEAVERVEVSVRTRWAHAMAIRHGAHAHMQVPLFKCPWEHTKDLARVAAEIDKSKEAFVQHYRSTYDEPFLPPIWAIVETMTLGTLSRWVANTKDNAAKKEVADGLGMPTVEVLEQVLHALTPVRNACAHHSRLWNRRMPMTLPHIKRYQASLVPPNSPHHQAHHLYNYLTVLAAMMKKMNPGGSWPQRVGALISTELDPQLLSAMGFPADWATRPLWVVGGAP